MYAAPEDLPAEFSDIIGRFAEGYVHDIDCETGWFHLVLKCHEELKSLMPDYKIAQIKEKFGELRYYIEFPEDTEQDVRQAAYKIIDKYERISRQTSEISGRHGYLYKSPGGLFKTVNPDEAPANWTRVQFNSSGQLAT